MSTTFQIDIIGAKVACEEGVKDSWREVAYWVARQLRARFGEAVQVRYYDLFEPDCPPLPKGAQLPLVMVNSEVLTSGGKIAVPAIRKYIERAQSTPSSARR